jgi:formylmethanofuran dehydrogenase subunit A
MATASKRLYPRTWAADRELMAIAKTMTLEAIAKKTRRKPEAILKMAKRLGITTKGWKAKG